MQEFSTSKLATRRWSQPALVRRVESMRKYDHGQHEEDSVRIEIYKGDRVARIPQVQWLVITSEGVEPCVLLIFIEAVGQVYKLAALGVEIR